MNDLFEEQLMSQIHNLAAAIKNIENIELRQKFAAAMAEYAKPMLAPSSYEKLTALPQHPQMVKPIAQPNRPEPEGKK